MDHFHLHQLRRWIIVVIECINTRGDLEDGLQPWQPDVVPQVESTISEGNLFGPRGARRSGEGEGAGSFLPASVEEAPIGGTHHKPEGVGGSEVLLADLKGEGEGSNGLRVHLFRFLGAGRQSHQQGDEEQGGVFHLFRDFSMGDELKAGKRRSKATRDDATVQQKERDGSSRAIRKVELLSKNGFGRTLQRIALFNLIVATNFFQEGIQRLNGLFVF